MRRRALSGAVFVPLSNRVDGNFFEQDRVMIALISQPEVAKLRPRSGLRLNSQAAHFFSMVLLRAKSPANIGLVLFLCRHCVQFAKHLWDLGIRHEILPH